MEDDIARLKQLVAEFETLVRSSQPYAYNATLNILAQIECQTKILRTVVVDKHKGKP